MEQTGTDFLALPDNPDQDPMLDWREVFANDQPVEIEIGIGKGGALSSTRPAASPQ